MTHTPARTTRRAPLSGRWLARTATGTPGGMNETPLTAIALVCTLSPSPSESSTQVLTDQVLAEFSRLGVRTETVRVVDHDVKPGIAQDMGDGDEWPRLRQKVLDSDILVLASPVWLGHPSSVMQRVLERLNADISETDDQGRPLLAGRVATVAAVGNEDGAHHIAAEALQGLSDLGFSTAPKASTYWVGEAMTGTDYKDLDETPEAVASTTASLARTATHLAGLLRERPYPAAG